jgi:hypothetical protein
MDNITNVMGNMASIAQGCMKALGSTNGEDIVFETVTSGSTIVTGSGQVQNRDVNEAAQTFSDTILSGIPGTSYSASSVSIQYAGQGQGMTETTKKRLIIAAVIGLVFARSYFFI